MSAPLSVSGHARDLNIQLNDSCNCCCFQWRRRVNPEMQVYVNSYGEVVRFDPRKAADETEALRRCVSNLQAIIGEMADARSKDRVEILAEIDRRIVELKADSPTPITLEMVQGMLDIVKASRR
jgi:hypothetical protein